jgi:hypothetical protein
LPRFSEYFGLRRTQQELDFVDVPVDADVQLYVDPFAISHAADALSVNCYQTLHEFFSRLVECLRADAHDQAWGLLQYLKEPNETRLGLSSGQPRGAGIAGGQAEDVLEALKASTAVRTGFLRNLEECELMIPGIGRDKISDLTTNVIRRHLAEYTLTQAELWSLPVQKVSLPPAFDIVAGWTSSFYELPVAEGRPVLLVPRSMVRRDPAMQHDEYYRHHVLNYLQAEHLSAGSSLVRSLKNGTRKVYKKDLAREHPCTKDFLFEFSKKHPDVLQKYRHELERLERQGDTVAVAPEEERLVAEILAGALREVRPGNDEASVYHSLIIGILDFLLFPHLLHPKKEQEIHEGRKRIDIVMENGAHFGIWHRLATIRRIPVQFVPIECKNYGREVANPELDQLAGRFSPGRGKVGILCCRQFDNRELFIQRCRDTFKDERGLIFPLDDERLTALLAAVQRDGRKSLDALLTEHVNEVAFS